MKGQIFSGVFIWILIGTLVIIFTATIIGILYVNSQKDTYIINMTDENSTYVERPVKNITITPTPTLTNITCHSNLPYPDYNCTPGVIMTTNATLVCTPGYSASVRNVSESIKEKVYNMYGIYNHTMGEYEIDHWVPLELGGSNDIRNLFPEPAMPHPGFHEKDRIENYLHNQVCNGSMTLEAAQQAIYNWEEYINLT